MSLHQHLLGLSIAYSKDNEGMAQVEYLREKLGVAKNSMQVEFSRLLQASKPEWREMAQLFRETGKAPQFKPGSYREKVFKNALEVLDHEMGPQEQEATNEQEARIALVTKRKLVSNPKATGTSIVTRFNKKSKKNMGKRPSNSPPRHTRSSPKKKSDATSEAGESHDFEVVEKPLEELMDGFNQVQRQHNSMKRALAEARKSNRVLKKEKSALESELEHISELLEEESESLDKLKVENKMLRDKLAARVDDTDALARNRVASRKLKTENAALTTELENTKEEHQQELTKKANRVIEQQKTNRVLRKQISDLRRELEQLSKLNCRTAESCSLQTRLLQEQCKALLSPGGASAELPNRDDTNTTPITRSDRESHKTRRISL